MATNQGIRLKVARLVQLVSPEELGEMLGVDPDTILAYENEEDIEIPTEFLWNAAEYLDVELSFFLRNIPLVNLQLLSHALDRMPDTERDIIIAQAIFWLENYLDLEALVPLEELPIGQFPEGFPMEVTTAKEAVEAANALRHAWDLGMTTPLQDLSGLLAKHGIKVGMITGFGQLDSVAMLSMGDFPMPVILTRATLPGDYQRFTMVRELAYFMLKNPSWQIASHFAGSLLMPARVLRREIGRNRTQIEMSELHQLKIRYGISMRFLLTRIASHQLIPHETYDYWMRRFRTDAWILAEPGGPYAPEVPTYAIQKAARFVAEGEISKERAAELLQLDDNTWETMLSLGETLSEDEIDAYFDSIEDDLIVTSDTAETAV